MEFKYQNIVFYDKDLVVASNQFSGWLRDLEVRGLDIEIVSSNMTSANVMGEQVILIYVAYKELN